MNEPAEPPRDRVAEPFDKGLQPERTALAWRRTSLSLLVGALVGARVLPHFWGVWGLIAAGVGVLLSLLVIVLADQRYRTHHELLTSGQAELTGLNDGALPALVAAMSTAAGVAALILAFRI